MLVFLRENHVGRRDEPVDSEVGVVPLQGVFSLWGVIVIAFILENGHIAQHRESVCEAFGYKEPPMVLVVKLHSHILSVSR